MIKVDGGKIAMQKTRGNRKNREKTPAIRRVFRLVDFAQLLQRTATTALVRRSSPQWRVAP
jgi:hypothetical protein